MRLFTAVDLPGDVTRGLAKLIDDLRPHASIRWSRAENLHITTKFIGEWPAERLEELEQVLTSLAPPGRIGIRLQGLGWFPNPHHPRVFWVAVEADPALRELAAATDRLLARLGVPPEDRPFTPHLTLARTAGRGGGPAGDLSRLRRAVAALDAAEFGQFEARDFHLYLSELAPGGSRYTRLRSFPLEPVR